MSTTIGPASTTKAPSSTPHQTVVTIGVELAALVASVVIAGYSDKAGTVMVAVWIALAVVWAVNYYSR